MSLTFFNARRNETAAEVLSETSADIAPTEETEAEVKSKPKPKKKDEDDKK